MSILNDLKHYIAIFGLLGIFVTSSLGSLGIFNLFIYLLLLIVFEIIFSFTKNDGYFPYSFFVFSPLLLINYSSIKDFQIRFFSFIVLSYIIAFAIRGFGGRRFFNKNLNNLSFMKIWFIAFLIFSVTGVLLFKKGVFLAGDEPDFLIISQSIVEDGDFELSNNYQDESYFKLKPELRGINWKIAPHITMHKGKMRSFHMPGVSFLMVPFYALYKIIGNGIHPGLFFRFATAFYNAFFALSIFVLLRIYFGDKNIFGFWLLMITSFPLLFHSITIFPEIPAGLMAINVFIFGFTKYKNYYLAGFFLALLPWFHVKYYPFVLVIGVAILFSLIRNYLSTGKKKDILYFIIYPAISLILLMLYCKLLYGTVNPTQIFPKQNYFVAPFLKIKVFFAYFIDQRDGLISYAPFLFFFLLGIRGKFDNKKLLITATSFYVLLHAFTTVRGAYAPAGRPLVFVIWVFILFLANFYFNAVEEGRILSLYLFRIFTGITYFFTLWFFYYPFFMFQPVFSQTKNRASDIYNFLSGEAIKLPSFFPSFLTNPNDFHIANIAWIAIIFLSILLFYTLKKPMKIFSDNKKNQIIISVLLFVFLNYSVSFYTHTHLLKDNFFKINGVKIYKTAKLFHYLGETVDKSGKKFRLKEGYDYDMYIDMSLWKNKRKKIELELTKSKKTDIAVYNKDNIIYEKKNCKNFKYILNLSSLKTIKIDNRRYGHVSIKTKDESNEHIYMVIRRPE